MEKITNPEHILMLLSSGVQVSIEVPKRKLQELINGSMTYVAWVIKEPDMSVPGIERWLQNHQQELWYFKGVSVPSERLHNELTLKTSGYKVMGIWKVTDFLLGAIEVFERQSAQA